MNPCSEALKQAREKLNLSLEDISAATKINIKFLKAIDNGDFNFLNDVYIKAFIRSYAKEVGLDPEECVRKYIESILPKQERAEPQVSQLPQESIKKVRLPKQKGVSNTTILIIVSIFIVFAFIFSLNLFKDDVNKDSDREIPFQEAVKKIEQSHTQDDSSLYMDSAYISPVLSGRMDSLILSISTNESAWISVLIDEKYKNEILLMPNKSVIWKALDSFKLTTGNAGALNIKLNNKTIPSIGKRGAVVKDVVLSRKSLE